MCAWKGGIWAFRPGCRPRGTLATAKRGNLGGGAAREGYESPLPLAGRPPPTPAFASRSRVAPPAPVQGPCALPGAPRGPRQEMSGSTEGMAAIRPCAESCGVLPAPRLSLAPHARIRGGLAGSQARRVMVCETRRPLRAPLAAACHLEPGPAKAGRRAAAAGTPWGIPGTLGIQCLPIAACAACRLAGLAAPTTRSHYHHQGRGNFKQPPALHSRHTCPAAAKSASAGLPRTDGARAGGFFDIPARWQNAWAPRGARRLTPPLLRVRLSLRATAL